MVWTSMSRRRKRLLISSRTGVGVEVLAGEDVRPDEAALGERVHRDVAFGDHDEPGNAPVFWLAAGVAENVGLRDLGHPHHFGDLVQNHANDIFIRELVRITSVSVNNDVHRKSLLREVCTAVSAEATRWPRERPILA